MGLMKQKVIIYPNNKGYLYKDYKFEKELGPGEYKYRNLGESSIVITLPLTSKIINVTNQEVLTKDNVSLRFSFFIQYKIIDGKKLLDEVNLAENHAYIVGLAENRLHLNIQSIIRDSIAMFDAEELNLKRKDIEETVIEASKEEGKKIGIEVESVTVRDILFPKNIQDILAKQLEAKIRSKADLDNARTQVATARALKNASEMMKDNNDIKFIQLLETMTKISEKGKHMFIFGDMNEIIHKHIR